MPDNPNRAIKRVMSILRTFEGGGRELSLSELATEAGLDKATVLRLTRGLIDEGLLKRDVAGNYSIAYGLLALAIKKAGSEGLVELAVPYLEAARDACGETVQLNIRSGEEVVVLAHRISRHPLRWDQSPGRRSPIFAGAASLAILAFMHAHEIEALLSAGEFKLPGNGRQIDKQELVERLGTARAQGYIVTTGERVPGGWGVGAPVFDSTGEAIGSISANGPVTRLMEPAAQDAAIRAACSAAQSLSAALQRSGAGISSVAAEAGA